MTAFQRIAPHQPVPESCKGAVWVIGNCDGVHRGHQALIQKAHDLADGRPVGVLSFEPHPRQFFHPEKPFFRLTPAPLLEEALSLYGVNALWLCAFEAELAKMSAEHFLERFLKEATGIVVGEDFRFGRSREGDRHVLGSWCASHNLRFAAIPAVIQEGQPVSSSRIRAALEEGDVTQARYLLGRPWKVRSTVIHGEKRGREMGFPTLNMRLDETCLLRHGIYAVRARIHDQWIKNGVASFGRRPTFDNGAPLLETHLFDVQGDYYDQVMDIAFIGWIRAEEAFSSMEQLVAQMNQDAQQARRILKTAFPVG